MEIENQPSRIENRGALFLDRDGTLIIDKDYLADPAGVELIPGAAEELRTARDLGYKLLLFTNQSGIGRGYFTLADAVACNNRMIKLLGLGSDVFTEICIAPESADQPSLYRKPSPRFILESIARHSLDPAHCWMIGDRESDLEVGLNAGIRSAAVCTGKYNEAEWRLRLPGGATLHRDLNSFVRSLS
ncbi:MAG: HAD-IIIA family hydrolase [Opitutaceae bacterium]|nr:HAD-IIIA family hydrolase [Opitutaceae bacterium]